MFSALVIVNCSPCTRELAPLFYQVLLETLPGYAIRIEPIYTLDDPVNLYLLINPAGLTSPAYCPRLPVHFITYELENWTVLSRPDYSNLLRQALRNWTYDKRNAARATPDLRLLYVPIGYIRSPLLPVPLTDGYQDVNRPIDLLFLGYPEYPRRRQILQAFEAAGLSIKVEWKQDWSGMLALVRRAKICLNFSVFDDFNFQTIRLNLLLQVPSCVVSEDLIGGEAYPIVKVTRDQLVSTCQTLLANEVERRRWATEAHTWYVNRPWSALVDFPRLLPDLAPMSDKGQKLKFLTQKWSTLLNHKE